MSDRLVELFADRERATGMGAAGRERVVACWSVDRMVQGYEELIAGIYAAKAEAAMKPAAYEGGDPTRRHGGWGIRGCGRRT
jgi:hypothetical protein